MIYLPLEHGNEWVNNIARCSKKRTENEGVRFSNDDYDIDTAAKKMQQKYKAIYGEINN